MKKPTYKLPRIVPGKKVAYKKRHKWPYIVLSLVLVFVLLIGSAYWYLVTNFSYEHHEIEKTPEIWCLKRLRISV